MIHLARNIQIEMYKKYSDIKKKLHIEVTNKSEDNVACLTHFLHNHGNEISKFYKSEAEIYLSEIHNKYNVAEEPDLQYYLPIKWDIPFPPVKKPNVEFIDLFAGIGGIRLAFQKLGGHCVFSSEWNTFAQKTTKQILEKSHLVILKKFQKKRFLIMIYF